MTGETPYKIKPTHIAYTVRNFTKKDTGEADSSWLKIGVAWLAQGRPRFRRAA